MTTEAGRRLLDEAWDNFDAKPWGSLADHVAAIEAEARAALLAELEVGVEGLPTGIPRITGDPFLQEAWQQGWESGRVTVLDLIRKAGA